MTFQKFGVCDLTRSACAQLYKSLISKRAGSFKWKIFESSKCAKTAFQKFEAGYLRFKALDIW